MARSTPRSHRSPSSSAPPPASSRLAKVLEDAALEAGHAQDPFADVPDEPLAQVGARERRRRYQPPTYPRTVLETWSDAELGQAAADDVPEALDVLHARCRPLLFRFALGLTGDVEDADDLTQDTLAKAQAHRRTYNPAYPYHIWLRTILRRHHTSQMRRRTTFYRLTSTVREEDAPGLWCGEMPCPLDHGLDAIDAAERVAAIMRQLSPHEQSLLGTLLDDELTNAEIARRTGMNANTVRSQLLRARRRFQELYRQAYPEDAARRSGADTLELAAASAEGLEEATVTRMPLLAVDAWTAPHFEPSQLARVFVRVTG